VTALNNTWHPEHFFCAQCGRPFGDEGFHEKDGKAYCRLVYFCLLKPYNNYIIYRLAETSVFIIHK
jgi:paxillin